MAAEVGGEKKRARRKVDESPPEEKSGEEVRRWSSLLHHMDDGAEGSIVLQPVQECSDPLRQQRLQLRDVTLELVTRRRFRISRSAADSPN